MCNHTCLCVFQLARHRQHVTLHRFERPGGLLVLAISYNVQTCLSAIARLFGSRGEIAQCDTFFWQSVHKTKAAEYQTPLPAWSLSLGVSECVRERSGQRPRWPSASTPYLWEEMARQRKDTHAHECRHKHIHNWRRQSREKLNYYLNKPHSIFFCRICLHTNITLS